MNEITKEKVSIAVKNAVDDEKLMLKDIAKQFELTPSTISYLKNPKYWYYISDRVWGLFREWMYSGEKLRGYKPKGKDEGKEESVTETAEDPPKDIYADLRKAVPGKRFPERNGSNLLKNKRESINGDNIRVVINNIEDDEKISSPEVVRDIVLNIRIKLSIE